MRWLALACMLAIGCGRFGFAARGDGGESGDDDGDVAGDATSRCAGFDFCDDFEAPSLAPAWMTSAGSVLDTSHAHSGVQSVHVQSPTLANGQSSYVQIGEAQTLSSPITQFWVRGWFYITMPPAPGGNRMEIISVEQMGGGQGDYILLESTNTIVYSQFSGITKNVGAVMPGHTWVCLVFQIVRDTGNAGSLVLTSDTLPQTSLAATQTDAATPIRDIWFGIGFSGANVSAPQPPLDVWIDDVIVHHSAVTCSS